MTEEFGASTPLEEPKKNNKTIIIIVVVLLVLCCCCVAVAALLYFVLGDAIMQALNMTALPAYLASI